MLPVTNLPRPTVASVLAELVEQEVLQWISGTERKLGKPAYKEFIAHLPEPGRFTDLLHSAAARRDPPDAFAICEDLKNVLEWPVDGDLAAILVEGLQTVRSKLLRTRQIEWVMKTGRRWPHKQGTEIKFRCGDEIALGTVVSVDGPVGTAIVAHKMKTKGRYVVACEDLDGVE